MSEFAQTASASKTKRPLVLAALVISMFMAAIEGTIVATAMPNIVGDLGGFSVYSWVFSAFLLMQAVTTLIYGKLSDLFGRKPIFLIGVVIFLTGSLLCGLATTMTMLVVFRVVQGLGAGAVQPIVTTIVGDMYTVEERSKIQGYLASVWGISSVVGPLLGGFIVRFSDWAWIFWMNIPLGIIGMIGVIIFFHEDVTKEKKSIDYLGSSLFFIAISALIVVLVQGGAAWAWTSPQILTLIGVFIIGALLFIWQETKATAPMMPLGIWNNKLITIANLATLTSGMMMIGLSSFLPTYVQAVMGYSAIVAGFTLCTMSIGWPISATIAGHLVLKIGFRPTAILGGIALGIGGLLFVFLDPDKGPVYAGISSFVVGVGMGLSSTTFIVSIQGSVDWKTRGVATSLNMFMRIIGSALGAAVLGGVLNMRMNQLMQDSVGAGSDIIDSSSTNALLDETMRSRLPENALVQLQDSLSTALHAVYIGLFAIGLITFALTLFFPKIERK
ncbi:MDR family MFS transporter [Sediminibacillus halophilus]|uniref:Drug resistance transporter, EmrB/QacA subfamily n=1 Tax=Sediminibacillus halophilus TaxID=482461 RepID=A0A1G9S476_9BACI|nr:MDR family MFS transporter [Sediminibacillus halophilus]SDM30201.1 drug resistance transporter, EmrB/QacA subfamily [Sediminibacillus halophilus]